MIRYVLCVAVLLAAVPLVPAADPAADEQKSFEAAVTEAWKKTKLPGAVVAVYRPGKPALVVALGHADADKKMPMTPDCHFRVASVSKVFVGTALLTLVDEGKVSADDAISKFVKDVPNGDKMTLRHLATHRSGLFNPIESNDVKAAFAKDPAKWWTEDDILAFSLKADPYFAPGEKHHYSNANTILLAKVIEKATGKPWADEVAARVFKPLGMKNTSIPTTNELPKPFARGYALGGKDGPFFVRGDVLHDVTATSPSWWGAAGSVISTIGDLGKAAKPLATGALLKDKGKKELLAWTTADQPGFEYGFHIEKTDGMIGHDGDVPGYQTFMFYLPDHDATVVAVANLYGWSVRGMPANTLAKIAIAHCFPPKEPPAPKGKDRERAERIEKGLRPFAEATAKPQTWTLADRIAEHGVPGVSVAVIDGGHVVWAKGYGWRDADAKQPVDTRTRFQAGSISKFATAVVALRASDAKSLDLDADVNTLLRDWKLPRDDMWKATPVTARMLLTHTAGIGARGFVGYSVGTELPSALQVLDGRKPANSPAVRVSAEPGTRAGYSGGGYQILQQVLSETSGEPFSSLAERTVFRPLKLPRTGFDQPARSDANTAAGHDGNTPLPGKCFTYPELAAAGLWSTPTEVAELALAVRASARGEQGSILRKDTAQAMLSPAILPGGKRTGHGLGPEIDGEGRTLRFGHSGGTVGFRCVFVLFVESGQGAVVMTNGSGDALMNEILRAVAAEYSWPGDDFKPKVRDAISVTKDELAAFTGDYAIEGNNTPYTVAVDGDGLKLETRYKAPIRLLPSDKATFFGTSHDREVRFERDDKSGRVTAATVYAGKQELFRLLRK